MKMLSRVALFAASRVPRGYYKIISAAARRDPQLRSWPVSLREPAAAEMICDFSEPVFTEYLRHGLIPHQASENRLFRQIAAPGDLVFDVGANVGYTAMLFADAVGPHGKVVAIEPGARTFAYLTRNIEHNRRILKNITPLQLAASDQSGEATFFDSPMSQLSSLEPIEGSRNYVVPVERLDTLSSNYGHPQLVKIDVEGHESRVLSGLSMTLASARPPIVIFEALDVKARDRSVDVIKSCSGDYSFGRISESGKVVGLLSARGHNDYVALPSWAGDRLV